jgi:hypothetical protein
VAREWRPISMPPLKPSAPTTANRPSSPWSANGPRCRYRGRWMPLSSLPSSPSSVSTAHQAARHPRAGCSGLVQAAYKAFSPSWNVPGGFSLCDAEGAIGMEPERC